MFTPKSNLLAGRRVGGSRSNTPLSGSRRTPLHASRTRSNQGNTPLSRTNVIEDTGSHVLATFGSPLPVLVTEVLTLASASDVTVSLSENGWAWLVSGRRLIVWRYSVGGRAQCRELSLPPSDLTHRSDLCAVYSLSPSQTPCCLAVSPEGVVRYWASIVHEGCSSDVSTQLGGQECFSLTPILAVGCILATTTSSLILIHHTGQGVACKNLQSSSNLLGGIGRRVSSLLWGSTVTGEAKLLRVVGTKGREPESRVAMVLTSTGLQKWVVEDEDTNRQIYDTDVMEIAREAMWTSLTGGSTQEGDGGSGWIKMFPLDISIIDDEHLALLVAGMNTNENGTTASTYRVHYGILKLKIITDSPPMRKEGFTLLSLTNYVNEGEYPGSIGMQIVEGVAYLNYNNTIQPVDLTGEHDLPSISLTSGDILLGLGATREFPLVFTMYNGVVSVLPSQQVGRNDSSVLNDTGNLVDKSSTKLSDSLNISVSAQGLENLTMSESKTDQLKAAFLLFCKRCVGQSQSIIEDLFPDQQSTEKVDSALDRLVLSLSKDLIDDFPASDPRWMESLPASQVAGTGGTMSMLVLHQLEDKLTCHELFIDFLKATGLWSRLSAVTVGGKVTATVLCLAEHNEKNVSAVTLRKIHSDHAWVVENGIKACLDGREITASGNLTAQDHFYREISRVDELLENFVTGLQLTARSSTARELVENIISVNTVVLTLLKAVLNNRNNSLKEFNCQGFASGLEYLPWTSMRRPQLSGLFKLAVTHGLKSAESASDKARLNQQVVELADYILDGYRTQLNSLTGEKKGALMLQFEREREQLVTPLLDLKLYDQAASLAEQYHEFGALVRICEETENKDKLEEYIHKYSEHNFSEFVFSWYVKEGKQSRLLAATGRSKELGRFLSGHSDISWLHDIHTENLGNAASTLTDIAKAETDILARKKIELSLAKLSLLGADHEDQHLLQQIDQELMLVQSQEQIPRGVIEQFGLDATTMRVLSPREMIEMYIGEENSQADCIEFIKALDLLNYLDLDEAEVEKVRLHIWCQSILRDSWAEIDTNNPLQSVQETTFFKIVEYAFQQGLELGSFLPAPESILNQGELGDLRKQANFQFLLQTGYEHVQRVCAV